MKYKIKKGNHSCCHWPHINLYKKSTMNREVTFDKSCAYNFTNEECQNDINKAFGFSYGKHDKNSIRLGWKVQAPLNPNDYMRIQLYLYCYVDGTRKFARLGGDSNFLLPFDVPIRCTLYVTSNGPILVVSYKLINTIIERNVSINAPNLINHQSWGYDLFPYFGGNCTAPNTMYISLD